MAKFVSLHGQMGVVSLGGGSGFILEYQAIYDQFITKPSDADAEQQNIFVTTLVNGGVWSILDLLLILASHSIGSDSLMNWIHSTGTFASLVNSPTLVLKQGYTSDGLTSYINTNFIGSIDGLNYTQDDVSGGIYCRTDLNEVKYDMGSVDGGDMFMGTRLNNNFLGKIHSSGSTIIANANSLGNFHIERTLGVKYLNINGVKVFTDAEIATAISTGDIFILAQNNAGTPAFINNKQISLLYLGAYLGETKNLILYNAFQTLMTHYGTQV